MGTNPPPEGVDVEAVAFGRVKDPTVGGAGIEGAEGIDGAAGLATAAGENPNPAGAELGFDSAGFSDDHPAFLTALSRCCSYCCSRPGSTSLKLVKAFFSSVVVMKDRMEVFRPRIAV